MELVATRLSTLVVEGDTKDGVVSTNEEIDMELLIESTIMDVVGGRNRESVGSCDSEVERTTKVLGESDSTDDVDGRNRSVVSSDKELVLELVIESCRSIEVLDMRT